MSVFISNFNVLNILYLLTGSPEIIEKSKDATDGGESLHIGGTKIPSVTDGTDTLINFDNENELSSSSFSSSYSGDLLHFQNASDDLI